MSKRVNLYDRLDSVSDQLIELSNDLGHDAQSSSQQDDLAQLCLQYLKCFDKKMNIEKKISQAQNKPKRKKHV